MWSRSMVGMQDVIMHSDLKTKIVCGLYFCLNRSVILCRTTLLSFFDLRQKIVRLLA